MELGIKKIGESFCPFSSITKEEKVVINKILRGEIDDILNGYVVVRDEELLFTLRYYVNCERDKLTELHQLLDKLERP